MNTLVSGFWGEGISDKRFLPVLIERTLEEIMQECAEGEWEIIEPVVLQPKSEGFAEQVLDLSHQANGFHLLFIHLDADAPDESHRAIPHKIAPALETVRASQRPACQEIIPVIPVTKIENWKLADTDALREAIGTDLDDRALGLNIGTQQLEGKSGSKEILAEAIKRANEHRKRRAEVKMEDLDAALAKGIALRKIYRFASFQKFVERLKDSLIRQNIIKSDCKPMFFN